MKKVLFSLALVALSASTYEPPSPYPIGFQATFFMAGTGEAVTGTWNGETFVSEAGANYIWCQDVVWNGPGHSCWGPPPPLACITDTAHTGRSWACDHGGACWWQMPGISEEAGHVHGETGIRWEDIPEWVPFVDEFGVLHENVTFDAFGNVIKR